jgi:TolB-like protein
MSKSPDSLTRFWQELKRRKVFSVVTTYAATAYIIIEVTNNLSVPLNLPFWISKLVLLLLVVGLPVAVVLSWIFDFTPQGIKKTEPVEESESKEIVIKPVKRKLRPSNVLNAILIIAVIILAWPKIFPGDPIKRLKSKGNKISIAVMPFKSLSNDTTFNILQDALQLSLISALSNTGEFSVKQKETINAVFQAQGIQSEDYIPKSVSNIISKKLEVDVLIYGSVQKTGSLIRLDAQLVDTKTKDVLKSIEITDRFDEDKFLGITDSLRKRVIDFLLISKLMKENPIYRTSTPPTTSPEAYRYFIFGSNALHKKADFKTAISWYLKAVALDSNFYDACYMLVVAYNNEGMADQSLYLLMKLYNQKGRLSPNLKLWVNYLHSTRFESPAEQLSILKQIREIDDQDIGIPYVMGNTYLRLDQYDNAITEYKKTMEIVHRIGQKDSWIYASLGEAYHLKGDYRKEKRIYRRAERYYQDHSSISFSWVVKDQAILALTERNTTKANKYIEKYRLILKENSWTDPDIENAVESIYSQSKGPG